MLRPGSSYGHQHYGHAQTEYTPPSQHINGMIVAVQAAKQGVTAGEDAVSGFMFADDSLSEAPEGLQKQIA